MRYFTKRSLVTNAIPLILCAQSIFAEDLAKTDLEVYQEECGACHIPYPAEFLPKRSWEKLLATLNDHFGDSAELAKEDLTLVTRYLSENSADTSERKLSKRILKSLPADVTPLRITEIPFIQGKHSEIPKKQLENNLEVKSFSQCNVCHKNAAQGSFRESEISIPGHGSWHD